MRTLMTDFHHLKNLSAAQLVSIQTIASDAAAGLDARIAEDAWKAAQARAAATRAAAARANAPVTPAPDRHGWAAIMNRVAARRK